MGQRRTTMHGLKLLGAAGLALAALVGCSGDDGPAGSAGATGVVTAPAADATALSMAVTGVTVSSPPVVSFRVTNQNGEGVVGLTRDDLRFTMAKLVPGSYGQAAVWQSYINTSATGAAGTPGAGTSRIQATREGGSTGAFVGTLADNGDGSYTYTFRTDITRVTSPLAVSYEPSLTHRVGVQTRGSLPLANAVYTFRPADGSTSGIYLRDIVKTEKCNACHNTLQAHDQRIETRYCVTCHNPGSSDPDTGNTVDFKVMIHKIHRGEFLPSVEAGGKYQIIGFGGTVHDYSTVVFPQDIRNCTKCHDGADPATPQGDNWKLMPSREACGSCHDNVNFATGVGHAGGAKDNTTCSGCHSRGGMVGPVEESHKIAAAAETEKFRFNLVSVTGTTKPVIKFSVTDPTNNDAPYNITTHSAFTQVPSGVSRLAISVAWNTKDFTNAGSGANPGQPITVYPTPTCGGPASGGAPASADWSCTVTSGVYTLTKLTNLPVTATGTGRVAIDGHPAAQDALGAWTVRVPVKNVYKDFAITGTSVTARRQVVDIAKCNSCHAQLSLHGNNRTDEPQVCVICHNPNDTDVNRRPKTGGVPDVALAADGKKMQAIDFRVLIHAIHGAHKRAEDDPNAKLVVYGFGGSVNDFSHVRFPGILNDCTTCHVSGTSTPTTGIGTYELAGTWDPLNTDTRLSALYSDLQGTTVDAAPTAIDAASLATQLADPADDLKMSPTAAVCSSCHVKPTTLNHMAVYGAIGVGTTPPATQATISANPEGCVLCHGPGKLADVKVMHGIK